MKGCFIFIVFFFLFVTLKQTISCTWIRLERGEQRETLKGGGERERESEGGDDDLEREEARNQVFKVEREK